MCTIKQNEEEKRLREWKTNPVIDGYFDMFLINKHMYNISSGI